MKRVYSVYTACTALVTTVGAFLGCSNPGGSHNVAPAPPPPVFRKQTIATRRAREARRAPNVATRRKLVIGLLRFVPDPGLGDENIKEGSADKTRDAKTNVNVSVDVRMNDRCPGHEVGTSLHIERYWRQILKRELLESGRFVVVDRDNLGEILHEIKFGESRYVNPQTSPLVGEIVAVQYLLEASIGWTADPTFKGSIDPLPRYDERSEQLAQRILAPSRDAMAVRSEELRRLRLHQALLHSMAVEYPYSAYLSLCDVRTAQIVANGFGIGPSPLEALRDAVMELADACAEMTPPARIARVDGDRVFVDLGSDDGLMVGQRLRYVRQGPAIRNATGQIIGYDTQEGGRLEITQVEPRMAIARVIECAREPTPGDPVDKEE